MPIPVTKETIRLARKANLYQFLVENHDDKLIHEGMYVRLKDHPSICIKMNHSGYSRFSNASEHGNGIDLLTSYFGYEKLDAIKALTGETVSACRNTNSIYHVPEQSSLLDFPKPAPPPYSRVFAYLTKCRGLSCDTVSALMKAKLLYQEVTHMNAVFMNREQDYCEIHSSISFGKSFHSCRRANPATYWSFRVGRAQHVTRAYICEGAIDAISLYELLRRAKTLLPGTMYCSIGGVSNQKAIDAIALGEYEVYIAVDNDTAGAACRNRNSNFSSIIPQEKDWNDDLQSLNRTLV